jgi:E3 ubiquitin-protein ligase DOA10
MRQCRYCLESSHCCLSRYQLISPCQCKGNLKWVHVQCWIHWIHQDPFATRQTCEICTAEYILQWWDICHFFARCVLDLCLLGIFLFAICTKTGIVTTLALHTSLYLRTTAGFPQLSAGMAQCTYLVHCCSLFFHLFLDFPSVPLDILCVYLVS